MHLQRGEQRLITAVSSLPKIVEKDLAGDYRELHRVQGGFDESLEAQVDSHAKSLHSLKDCDHAMDLLAKIGFLGAPAERLAFSVEILLQFMGLG